MAGQMSFNELLLKIGENGTFYLVGSKCKKSGDIFYPQQKICPTCFTDDTMEQIQLSKRGKIYSFAITERQSSAPPGVTAPYAFGYVDLPEGVRLLTRLNGLDKLKIGAEVEMGLEPRGTDDEGNKIIGFYFKPV